MEHLWWDLGSCAGTVLFEVELRGSTARLCLMDAGSYQAHLDGDEYEFFGDFTAVSPVMREVPYDGYWYLVVDSDSCSVRASVSQVFD